MNMCSICNTTLLGSMNIYKRTKQLDYLDEIVGAFKSLSNTVSYYSHVTTILGTGSWKEVVTLKDSQ